MKYTAINIPSLERIANALEKQNKLQEKAIEQSERMLKLQENYFKGEEERPAPESLKRVDRKMDINAKRTWCKVNGVYRHKES